MPPMGQTARFCTHGSDGCGGLKWQRDHSMHTHSLRLVPLLIWEKDRPDRLPSLLRLLTRGETQTDHRHSDRKRQREGRAEVTKS